MPFEQSCFSVLFCFNPGFTAPYCICITSQSKMVLALLVYFQSVQSKMIFGIKSKDLEPVETFVPFSLLNSTKDSQFFLRRTLI